MNDKSLFRIPNYPAWFGADTFLLAGSAVHWIVVSLMAYELSGSVVLAGWFATARGVVSSITQVTGGAFIDRHDHRTLILVQAGVCACLWLAMGTLFVLGRLTFELFALLCLSSSAIFGFLGGTTNASLIRVVGPERYAQAESLNQGRDAAVNTAGSPLGAALYGISHAFPFFASALFDALAFASAWFLRLPHIEREEAAEKGDSSFFGDLLDGWRWVFSSKRIVSAVLIIGLCEFGAFAVHQATNLTLVQAGTDPVLISMVNVASGFATILGSLVAGRVCDNVPVGKGVVCILLLMALAYVPMLIWQTYPAILVSSALARMPMPLFAALVNGFVFSKTPVEKQGRTRAAVMCALMLFSSGSGGLAGEMLASVGFVPFIFAMDMLVLVGAGLAALNPLIRTIPASPEWGEVDL